MWRVAACWSLHALCSGCTPAKAPVTARQNVASASEKPAPTAERLALALRSIARPEPVLGALPESLQQRLRARFAALDAERRAAVHGDDGALVEALPLLHLISGGTSPRALYALATSSAGSDELSERLPTSGQPAPPLDPALPTLVGEMARRSALHFLRDRAADVAQGGKQSALVSRLVLRAAQAVGRNDLILLAREQLANTEKKPLDWVEWAEELARSGDPERAELCLVRARADGHGPPARLLAEAERLVDAARVATSTAVDPRNVTALVAQARAWLRLGRLAKASAALSRVQSDERTRLDVAAASAEAQIGSASCPDLPDDVGSAALCALAFRSSERVARARGLLESAWQSGTGRDDEAVEVYVALEHVIPWMHETASGIAEQSASPEQSALAFAALLAKIREIARVAPHISGVLLFLETVPSGPLRHASGLASQADSAAFSARALSLVASDSSRFAQAGLLAVAAALSPQQDITPLVDAIPADRTAAVLRVPRAALELWLAASSGDRERMDAARAELAAIMTEGRGSSIERARLVLGVAEADALLARSERAYQLLSRVAGQLLNDDVPPDLALRAVLDAAGALAHGQRFERAHELLASADHAEITPHLQRAFDLSSLIKGYELVLDAREARVAKLPELRAQLVELSATPHTEAATVWFELWLREFDALEHELACAKKKSKPCPEAALVRRSARHGLDERLGAKASAVLSRGALPGSSFEAGFRFTLENGLEPLIFFDPNFLAIGLPPTFDE